MRENVIHDAPSSADVVTGSEWSPSSRKVATIRPEKSRWDPERFAQEQIRSLVRQIFTVRMTPPVRQIVFSAVEPHVDVGLLSLRVAECLAKETSANIAVLMHASRSFSSREVDSKEPDHAKGPESLRQNARRCGSNLWLLNGADEGHRCDTSMQAYLARIRTEFWYSILEGPPVGASDEATAMAQFADGMILVLSAQRTRRATAIKVKQTLERANVRLLGSVLSDREFPIPEGIYRRL
jgi:hypothetical protein